jgi:hypothetical protein
MLNAKGFFGFAAFFFIVACLLSEWKWALSALPASLLSLASQRSTESDLSTAGGGRGPGFIDDTLIDDLTRPLKRIGRVTSVALNAAVALLVGALLVLVANLGYTSPNMTVSWDTGLSALTQSQSAAQASQSGNTGKSR